MTEAEWLTCDHPAAMLIYLRGQVSEQERAESRSRLHSGAGELFDGPSPFVSATRFTRFVAACAARLRQLPLDEHVCRFLDLVQRHADGETTFDEVCSRYTTLKAGEESQGGMVDGITLWGWGTPHGAGSACWMLAGAVARAVARESIAKTCAEATDEDWFVWGFTGGPPDPLYQTTQTTEGRAQADLLREVIGNPFRPVTIDPHWRLANDNAAIRIAQGIYEEEAFDGMPLLADVLMDAGCSDRQILEHCRGPDRHVRGCWLLDALLGR